MTAATTVLDVVLRQPKTLGASTTVAEARAALADDHVHMLLITDGGRLLGTLVEQDLASASAPDGPALGVAVLEGRTIGPSVASEEARALLLRTGQRRRAVVDDEGSLLGLLCLKRRLVGFCSDADVQARAMARAAC